MGGQRASRRTSAAAVKVAVVEDSFRHEALFYNGEAGFLHGTLPFVAEALEAEEPLLVAVSDQRAAALRRALGDDAARVRFLDMAAVGRNPARLIPAWREFVLEQAVEGKPMRGIGEAVWHGRSDEEIGECERAESLLNAAFTDGPVWRLLCPYDLDSLPTETIDAARRSHPALAHEGISRRNDAFLPPHRTPGPFAGVLADPPADCEELAFTGGGLGAVRGLVSTRATAAGLSDEPREDLVLAINELVTNSVQYGGGGGTLRIWTEPGELICDVRDRGYLEDPLAGRIPPPLDQHGGRGLWLVNHLCDLVQIRSSPKGTVIRVHMHIR
jgi:anti-sigma regulatory factor (Ser/Thr protein kinase)